MKRIETILICLKSLYGKTNRYRKELICADIISDEQYVQEWQGVEYVEKWLYKQNKVHHSYRIKKSTAP